MSKPSILTPPSLKCKKRLNSKNKGGTFERFIAKKLSLWYSNGKSDCLFYRTASSGGRGTQRFKRGQPVVNSAGDLSFLDSAGEPFLKCCSIELKAGYKAATINKLFSSSKPELLSFFTQAHESAQQAGVPCWIVIHKQDHQSVMLYCNAGLVVAYNKVRHIVPGNIVIDTLYDYILPKHQSVLLSVKIADVDTHVVGMRFDDFLTLDPTFFRPDLLFPNQLHGTHIH